MTTEVKKVLEATILNCRITGVFVKEIDSPRFKGNVATVNLETNQTLSDFEGGEFYDLYSRLKAGDRISFRYTGQKDATGYLSAAPEGTPTGGEAGGKVNAYNGSLDGIEILDIVEAPHVTQFADILKRDPQKVRAAQKHDTGRTTQDEISSALKEEGAPATGSDKETPPGV